MKIVVVIMGVLTVALVSLVEKLGMVFQVGHLKIHSPLDYLLTQPGNFSQLSVSLSSLSAGPMVTIFFSGLFLPWVTGTVSPKDPSQDDICNPYYTVFEETNEVFAKNLNDFRLSIRVLWLEQLRPYSP